MSERMCVLERIKVGCVWASRGLPFMAPVLVILTAGHMEVSFAKACDEKLLSKTQADEIQRSASDVSLFRVGSHGLRVPRSAPGLRTLSHIRDRIEAEARVSLQGRGGESLNSSARNSPPMFAMSSGGGNWSSGQGTVNTLKQLFHLSEERHVALWHFRFGANSSNTLIAPLLRSLPGALEATKDLGVDDWILLGLGSRGKGYVTTRDIQDLVQKASEEKPPALLLVEDIVLSSELGAKSLVFFELKKREGNDLDFVTHIFLMSPT